MSKISILLGTILACLVLGGAVSAQSYTAYGLATPAPGNEQYGATLGLQFTVNSAIVVNSLGAFDAAIPNTSTAHTLNGTIVTSIYNSVTQQVVTGLTATFSASNPGTLVGGYLFKPVGGLAGITLAPGNYVLAFTSITNNDQDANSNFANFTNPTYNVGPNLITINKTNYLYNEQSNPAYLGQDKYPVNSYSGTLDAGTFAFSAVTPEPGTVSLFAGLLVMGGSAALRRRLRKKTA